jgi:hypothetical protein
MYETFILAITQCIEKRKRLKQIHFFFITVLSVHNHIKYYKVPEYPEDMTFFRLLTYSVNKNAAVKM